MKDPTADTSFLPDKERDEEELKESEKRRREFLRRQEEIRNLGFPVTCSYWDGTGHQAVVTVSFHSINPVVYFLTARCTRFLIFIMPDKVIFVFADVLNSEKMSETAAKFEM
jgi:protein FAM50